MAVVKGDNSLFFASGLDNSGLLKGTLQAEGMIQGMAGNIAKINPFGALAVGAVASFGIIAKESYDLVREFDKAMKEVQTISEAAQNDFEGISNLVFDLSKLSPDKPKELAEAYYQVVSAGYDGADGLNLLATASKAAVAGVTDTKTAVDALTTILNSYKLTAQDSEAVSDALFNTVKLGKTTMEELSASISQVAPIASASNIALDEVLSSVATLTKQGVPTAQAMTQIRSAIVGLSEAGKLDGAKTLQENMQALFDEMDGNQTLILETVGRTEALQAVLAVSGKNALSASKDLATYNNVLGATEKASRTMLEENGNQWEIFGNRIASITKGLGDNVLKASNIIVGSLNDMLEPTENVTEALESEAKQVYELYQRYIDVNTPSDERVEILKQLELLSPNIVQGINDEADAYNILTANLSEYNKQLAQRKIFAEQQSDISNQNKEIIDLQYEALKFEESIRESLATFGSLGDFRGTEIESSIDKILTNANKTANEKFKEIQNTVREFNESLGENAIQQIGVGIDGGGSFSRYSKVLSEIEKKQKIVDKQQKELNDKVFLSQDTESNSANVIADINKTVTNEKLKEFERFKTESIKLALETRKGIVSQLEAIGNVQIADYKQGGLDPFLSSDNEEIKKTALAKRDKFNALINKSNQEYSKKNQEYLDKLRKQIQEEKKLFELRDKLIASGDYTGASEIKAGNGESSFDDYLQNVLSKTKNVAEKGVVFEFIKIPKAVDLESELNLTLSEIKPNDVELNFKAKQGLDKFVDDVSSSFDKRMDDIRLGDKGLFNLKAISKLTKEKNQLKLTPEINKEKLEEVNEDLGQAIAGGFEQGAQYLSQASDLFAKFGNEEMAELTNQLSGVASGIGQIASGDIIGGSLQVLNSALSVSIESQTAKFEKAIEELEKASDRIANTITNTVGVDNAKSRLDLIENIKLQEQAAKDAYEAEEKARKEVKFLGIKLGDKGSGSGTSSEKLEELEQEAEDAKQKVIELNEEYAELMTGVTRTTLADGIFDGLEDGKSAIQSFADTFEDIVGDAVKNAFKSQALDPLSQQFQQEIGDLSDNDGGVQDGVFDLTADEITYLKNKYAPLFDALQDEFKTFKQGRL